MGRRSDHSRDALHTLALDAAEKLVISNGLSGITARAVATEIGYTAGTLYNVFGNIDGLILALNYRTLGRLEEEFHAAALPTGNVDRDLSTLLTLYADQVAKAPRQWNLLLEHSLPDGQTPPDWYQARIETLLGLVSQVLEPLFTSESRKAAAIQSAQSARILWLSIHHLLTSGMTGTLAAIDAAEGEVLAKDLLETYILGLKHRDPSHR